MKVYILRVCFSFMLFTVVCSSVFVDLFCFCF